jgi:hypothetical protein
MVQRRQEYVCEREEKKKKGMAHREREGKRER